MCSVYRAGNYEVKNIVLKKILNLYNAVVITS